MFCPRCGAEFEPGVYECADCETPPVEEPPSKPLPPDAVLKPVFRTADASLLPVVEGVLRSCDIPFYVQGEEAAAIFPLGPAGFGTDGRALAAIVHVPEDRWEEARALLEKRVETEEDPSRIE